MCHQVVSPPLETCSGPWKFHHPLAMGICALLPPSFSPFSLLLQQPRFARTCSLRAEPLTVLRFLPHIYRNALKQVATGVPSVPCAKVGTSGEVALATVHGCSGSTVRLRVMAQGRTQPGHAVLWPWCPLCQPQLHPEPPLCCPIAHPLLLQGFLQQKGRKEGGRTPRTAHIFLQYEVDVTSTQKRVSQLERFQGLNAMGVSEPFKNTVHKRL